MVTIQTNCLKISNATFYIHICVSYDSQIQQGLFPLTALTSFSL
jgi:hypothetical protein